MRKPQYSTTSRDLTIAKNVVAWITANQTNLSTPSPSDVKAGEIFLFEKSSQEPGSRWVDRRSWEQVSRRQFQNMGCEISEEKRASDSLLTGPLLRKINWRNVKIDSKTYQLVVYEEAKPPDRRGEKSEQSDLPKDLQEKYPEEEESSHDLRGDQEIRSRSSHFFEVILNK